MANEVNPEIAKLESELGLNKPAEAAPPAQAPQPAAQSRRPRTFLDKVVETGKTVAAVATAPVSVFTEAGRERQANFAAGAVDVVQDMGNGLIDLVDATSSWAQGTGFKDQNKISNITFADDFFGNPETEAAKNARAVGRFTTQFATFVGGGAAAGALKAAKYVQGAAAVGSSAIANFLAFDPKEEQLNGLVREIPILKEILPEYLNAEKDDSEIELRFKNALSGVIDDVALAGVFAGVAKMYRSARGVKKAVDAAPMSQADEMAAAMREPSVTAAPKAAVKETPTAVSAAPQAAAPQAAASVQKQLPKANVVAAETLLQSAPDGTVAMNVKRLSSEQNVASVVQTIARENPETIKAATRGVIPDDEIDDLAREILADPAKMKASGLMRTAEEIKAARIFLNASAKDTIEKAAKYAETGSEEDLLRYMASFENTNKAMAEVSGAAAESGRALRAFRGDPAEMTLAEIQTLRDRIKMTGSPEEIRQAARQMAEVVAADPKKALSSMAKLSKDSTKKRLSDAAFGLWYSSMLSNPMTHVKNFVSNTVMQGMGVAERYGAWAVGGGKNISIQEANALAVQSFDSFMEGIQGIWNKRARADFKARMVNTGAGKLSVPQDAFRVLSKDGNMLTKGLAAPLIALQKSDEFFKTVAYSSELKAQSVRAARAEGLTGTQLMQRAEEIEATVKAGVDELSDLYPIHKQASDYAKQMTFTQQLPDGWMSHVSNLMDSLPMKMGKVIAPFTRVNLNMIDWVIMRNPVLAPLSRRWRTEVAKGGAAADLAISKVATGGLFTALGASAATFGYIRGSEPESKTARNMAKSAGVQFDSIKIGGTHFKLASLGPIGDILRMGADIHELSGYLEQDKVDELAALGAFLGAQISDSVTPDFMTDGVFEVLSAVKDQDENKVKAFIAGLGRSTVPGGLRYIQRTFGDETKRDTRGDTGYKQWSDVWQQTIREWKANIPGLSKTLPPQRNLFGEAITYAPGQGPENTSPIAYTTDPKSVVAFEEIARLALNSSFMKEDLPEGETELRIDLPRRYFQQSGVRIDLTPEQYDKFVQLSAGIGLGNHDPKIPLEKRPVSPVGTLRDALTSLVKSGYKSAEGLGKLGVLPADQRFHTDQNKRVAISKVVRAYRELAKKQLFQEFPEMRSGVVQKLESKLKAKDTQFQGLGR